MKLLDPAIKFKQIASRYPSTTAVFAQDKTVSYEQLYNRAAGIASYIQSAGHQRVAIYLGNSDLAYAAIFGVLLAGAEYCPLNIKAPAAKNENILTAYQADLLLLSKSAAEFPQHPTTTVFVEEIATNGQFACGNYNPDSIAYTIFTSGSTGTPKGVMIQRKALANYMTWCESEFPIQPGTRWSQHPNIGFDLSVLDIYGALCHGASLYPLVSEFDRLLPALFIQKHQIEIWNSVPSVLSLMLKSGKVNTQTFSSIKLITVCGEPLPQHTLDGLFEHLPDLRIQNTYGPTEATVSCTAIALNRNNYIDHCDNTACLGSFIPGMGYYIEKEHDSNVSGELVIYGSQIAKGYLSQPTLSDEKFFTEVINGNSEHCYRTGDIVYIKGNQLYFKCRKDDICKIKGRLLDLNEIEKLVSGMLNTPCYIAKHNESLHLFIERLEISSLADLREKLSDHLEAHELPETVTTIETPPLSQNDKVDKKALLALLKSSS